MFGRNKRTELAKRLGIAHTQCYYCGTQMNPIIEGRFVGKPDPVLGLHCPKCGSETIFKNPIEWRSVV